MVGQSVTIGLLTVMDALPPYAMRGTCKSGGCSHRVSLRRTGDTEEKGFLIGLAAYLELLTPGLYGHDPPVLDYSVTHVLDVRAPLLAWRQLKRGRRKESKA